MPSPYLYSTLFQLVLQLVGDSTVKHELDGRNLEEVLVVVGARHPVAGLIQD
jgi:hypothetical protein